VNFEETLMVELFGVRGKDNALGRYGDLAVHSGAFFVLVAQTRVSAKRRGAQTTQCPQQN
jgi:hypothetical protein